jgi:glutathione S-transferase
MYKLYNFQPSGNCYKLRLLLSQLAISYELVEVNILEQASRTPKFLAKNPNGRVPLLQVGEQFLPESNAGLWYLAQDSDFMPSDEFERAQVLQWLFFEQYSHEPNIATVRYWISILNAGTEYANEITEKRMKGYAALDVMETHLATQPYFVGQRYSIADIALYAYTHVAHEGGFDLSLYPHINRWIQVVASQPNYLAITANP